MMGLSRVIWREASLSNANGGQCVEFGVWSKSTLSGGRVEGALIGDPQAGPERTEDAERVLLVRDSKEPCGPVLSFTPLSGTPSS